MRIALPHRSLCLTITLLVGFLAQNAAAQSLPDSVNRLNVLSYNIFGRPFVVSHDGQVERSCRIPGEIFSQIANSSDIDVIVIQEAFTPGCRTGADLRTLLAFYGWPYSTRTVGTEAGKLANGGVFVASKWPIDASAEEVYSECSGPDCLAAKGVVYARIRKTAGGDIRHFSLFGTHLNAGPGAAQARVRLEQAKQLHAFIVKQNIPASEPALVAGDLNVDNLHKTTEVKALLAALGATLPQITGTTRATTDPENNPLHNGKATKWVDYVLYLSGYASPSLATLEAFALRTENAFEVCMSAPLRPDFVAANSNWCRKTLAIQDLSDHYPVLGRTSFPPTEAEPKKEPRRHSSPATVPVQPVRDYGSTPRAGGTETSSEDKTEQD